MYLLFSHIPRFLYFYFVGKIIVTNVNPSLKQRFWYSHTRLRYGTRELV
uniref:Uncharacterized protein n=1 Tax=Brassica campestris TaxID=3711 RepID=A0A3P5ZI04_BRACM|nr:unnamed protein product [Brassica rapa]